MKDVTRIGLFETNSSSVHSLTMCNDDMYKRWVSGDGVYFKRWDNKLVESTTEIEEDREETGTYTAYLTYNEFNDYDYVGMVTFDEEYTTESGETIHAFGYYGYDG